jgi:hypothetical protein
MTVNITVKLDDYEIVPSKIFSFINMTVVEELNTYNYNETIANNGTVRVPSVNQIYPMKMSADGGDVLNIYGSNFDISSFSCQFGVYGSVDAYVLSAGVIECRIPTGKKGVINFVLYELKSGDLYSIDIEYYDQLVILDAYARVNESLVTVRVQSDMGPYTVHGGGLNCVLNDNIIKGLIIKDTLICINNMIILNNTVISIIDGSGMFISNAVPIYITNDMNSSNTQLYGLNDGDVYYTDNSYSQISSNMNTNYSTKTPLSVMKIFNTAKTLIPFPIQNLAAMSSYNDNYVTDLVYESNDYNYIPKIIDAVCKINGTTYYNSNSFYNLDKSYFNSLSSSPVVTTPTPKLNRATYLILDTVNPLILDMKNSTWITITGKTFSNNTMCYLNSNVYVSTYYISPYNLKCSIPTMAIMKVWSVNLTLLEKFVNNTMLSINSFLLYYNDFNMVDKLSLKVPVEVAVMNHPG